jgi:hypothetical protein
VKHTRKTYGPPSDVTRGLVDVGAIIGTSPFAAAGAMARLLLLWFSPTTKSARSWVTSRVMALAASSGRDCES